MQCENCGEKLNRSGQCPKCGTGKGAADGVVGTHKTKYFSDTIRNMFNGRIGRVNWILGILIYTAVFFVTAFIVALFAIRGSEEAAVVAVTIIYIIVAIFILALHVRRLHDLNYSGWIALVSFVPFLNLLLTIILLFMPGEPAANTYGERLPKGTRFTGILLNRTS